MKSKVKSSGSGAFAKGGSGKMFGKSGVVPAPAGTTSPPKGAMNRGPAKGGSGKMFGKQSAKPQTPGQSRG